MPDCPSCQEPMILTAEDPVSAEGHKRCFFCRRCLYTEDLKPDRELSIDEISKDMILRSYVDACQEAYRQALYRKLSSALTEFNAGIQYLNAKEVTTLKTAADIIEKLASAAERSKRSKHLEFLQKEQMNQLRYRKLKAELSFGQLYDFENPVEKSIHILTLSEMRNEHIPPIDIEQIKIILRQAENTGAKNSTEHLINTLNDLYDDQREVHLHYLANQASPIKSLLSGMQEIYSKTRERTMQKHYLVIDTIANLFAMMEHAS